MAFIIPHKSDLIVDGQIIRQQLIENFKAIEQEESQLRNDLNDETDKRKSADIDERNARINADNRLQSQIDAIIQRLDTNEKSIADLQTRMKTAEEQIKKLNEIIFGYEYIDDTDLEMLDDKVPQPSEMEINDDVAVDDDAVEVAEGIQDKAINEVS